MTRARDLADVISGQFDIPAGSLDNSPVTTNAADLTSGTIADARLPTNLQTLDTLYGDNALTGRNLIMNGAMTVAQRGTSATVANGGPLTVDRFSVQATNFSQASFTESQSSTVPSGEGFANSLKVVCGGTAETTLDATDHLYIRYRGNEGKDVQHLRYGTSSAKKVTGSFWVRSSVTGDYAVMVYTNAGIGGGAVGRSQTKTYTINTADTWEYKTITFDGDGSSGNTLANDNTAEWQVYFTLASGSTQKATDGTSWGAYATGKFSYGQTADLSAVASSDWYITGVQFEVGETATPFEHESFGTTLKKCKRYYEHSYPYGTSAGTATTNGMSGGGITAVANASHAVRHRIRFDEVKCKAPAMTAYDSAGNSGKCNMPDTSTNVGQNFFDITTISFTAENNGVTTGDARHYLHYVANSEI